MFDFSAAGVHFDLNPVFIPGVDAQTCRRFECCFHPFILDWVLILLVP